MALKARKDLRVIQDLRGPKDLKVIPVVRRGRKARKVQWGPKARPVR
jgi:hypothetical protein